MSRLSAGLEPGRVVAEKYALARPAGFGGMAQLWVATNQATGAEVCVKLLVPDPDKGQDPESVERFRREAHAAASLSHRAIVRVFDLLELDEHGHAVTGGKAPHAYAIVMELLHGETLGEMLAKRGKLPVDEALDLFLPVVSALGHAHRASVIHRDLKPDNIFLAADPDGQVIPKILDFGVSKLERADSLTSDGVVVGTPTFMSPEQAKGSRRIDARSDVFSAGILFYMMLSGKNPFEDAPTFEATLDLVVRREVGPLADVPPAIWSVIERAIEKDPAARWSDCTEMGIALRTAAGRRSTTESDPRLVPATPVTTALPAQPSADPVATRGPPDPSPSFAAADIRANAALHRRRTIVVGVVGVSSLMVLAALILTALEPKQGASRSAAAATAGLSASATGAPAATPATEPTPPPASSSSAPVSTAASAPVPHPPSPLVRPTAAPRRPSGPARVPSSTPRPSAPHIARDPGF